MTSTTAERHASWTITMLGDVLVWSPESAGAIRALEAAYTEALSWRLGEVLGAIAAHDRPRGDRLRAKVEEATDEALVRSLVLPATSRRLVTGLHDLSDIAEHLDAVLPEAVAPTDHPDYLGTVLGSVPVFSDQGDDPDLAQVCLEIDRLFGEVAQHCPAAVTYVRSVMRELHLGVDATRPSFFSNSPQGLIGRAVLTNPHLPMADGVVLVEAIVHEATHGFVGMSEAVGLTGGGDARWLLDDGPYDGISRVVSPWTGTPLDIPTYLHACFVWWGLLHFWSELAGMAVFDERRVRGRIVRAAKGFFHGALVSELEQHRTIVQPALLGVLASFGEAVDVLLAETGLDRILSGWNGGPR